MSDRRIASTDNQVEFHRFGPTESLSLLDELVSVYAEVFSEPPYGWSEEHIRLFRERLQSQQQRPGFSMFVAYSNAEIIGFAFGLDLPDSSRWWSGLLAPLPTDVVTEWPGRTFVLIELLVRRQWRRQGIASKLHDLLLQDRSEERATLTALPEAKAAQAAYVKWGWLKVGQKRNPLPASPVFDILVKPLTAAPG
jgi:GNAT superfamily N-acetyltransferase